MANQLPFSKGEFVVYPTHGVGRVTGIETREIAGEKLKLFVIEFLPMDPIWAKRGVGLIL